ncbi:MAG: histidine kinase [Aureispira sp.]
MKFVLFIFLSLSTTDSLAQTTTIDSLKRLLSTPNSSIKQAALYQGLAMASSKINPTIAIDYSYRAQNLIGKQDLELKGKIYQARGVSNMYLEQYQEAIDLLDSAAVFLLAVNNSLEELNKHRSTTYYNWGIHVFYKNPKKTLEYVNKRLEFIPTNDYHKLSKSYLLQASAYAALFQQDRALVLFDSAIAKIQRLEDSPSKQEDMAIAFSNKAVIYTDKQQYQKAANLLYKAIEIHGAIGHLNRKAITLVTLANVHSYLEEPQTAIKYINQAIDILHFLDDTLTIELCDSYYKLATIHISQETWDTALVILDKIIPFLKRNEFQKDLALAYAQKSIVYRHLGQFQKAILYNNQALDLRAFLYSLVDIHLLYLNEATLYRVTGQLKKSKELYQIVIDSAQYVMTLNQALTGLIETAVLLKDFELAHNSNQRLQALKDSLATINNEKIIRSLELTYQTKELSQQNEALRIAQAFQQKEALQNRRLLYLSIGISILLVVLLLLFLQYKTTKNNAQTRELKYQLLRNQMNPHFLFNVLGAIQSFIYTNNPIKAGDFLSSFATLVRAILDNSTQEYISITKEVEWLENYLSLQALRFGDQLEYILEIDPSLQEEEFIIPPMLLQPILENALEHGFKDIDYKGHLIIKMSLVADAIEILVQDNGVGFDLTQQPSNKEHVSHATRITKERIDLLNKKNTKNITFKTNSVLQQGTTVTFQVPLLFS